MKTYNPNFITRLVTTLAILPIGLAGMPEAKADYYNTTRIGDSTYTYGSNGQRFNTNRIGNTTFYNGTDRYGNSYGGSCTTIGSSTFCN